MKNRKLQLVANVSGFDTIIATVKIQNFADEMDIKDATELVCPTCFEKPIWKGGYVCEKDNLTFNHWSKLSRVLRGTRDILKIPRLLEEKEIPKAQLSWMPQEEFAKKYIDATRKDEGEKGVIIDAKNDDDRLASAKNIFKILVGIAELGYVVIAKWKDTNEEVVSMVSINPSGRILLRELIPSNLAEVRETLFLDKKLITKEEIAEAKQFIKQFIPRATEETFKVNDYRAKLKDGIVTNAPEAKPESKVADIKAIMAQVAIVKPKRKK